jgi:hypothetical protein
VCADVRAAAGARGALVQGQRAGNSVGRRAAPRRRRLARATPRARPAPAPALRAGNAKLCACACCLPNQD